MMPDIEQGLPSVARNNAGCQWEARPAAKGSYVCDHELFYARAVNRTASWDSHFHCPYWGRFSVSTALGYRTASKPQSYYRQRVPVEI
jgi:hypothetical protein